ncbi:MAG: cyclic nucleotide-binding domain-containing protein [Archangium sp.]|nr:cyclic nucleotide-binding domain-containing protein [Archangium sp.]MDP3569977.1 cyclic nucleotide-binding domain-containing protein [Archangium sp.]
MEARALKDKASAFFTKGRFAKAAETYEEFCTLDKKDHQARLRCGDAWSKAGKKDKAIQAYSMAAEGYAKDGFLPRAIAASKLVLEIDPAHKGVQKMLAELYAQKSGGQRKPMGAAAAPVEMEVTRNVSAPVTSSFSNNKAAIDLDAPIIKAKPGYQPAKVEAPSPMNRADALELPEYEIPMADGPSSVGGMSAHTGPRAGALEIEVEEAAESGPKALTETSIDIDMTGGQSVSGEVEIPIEGQPLLDSDQLPPELQTAPPLAPAITFELPPPSPVQSFELEGVPPAPPADAVDELSVQAPAAPSRTSAVYDLTEAIPDPKPSVPVFELTVEAEAPPPELPPAVIIESLDPEPLDAPLAAKPQATIIETRIAPPTPSLRGGEGWGEGGQSAIIESLDPEPLDAPLAARLPPAVIIEDPSPLPPAMIIEAVAPEPEAPSRRSSALPPSVGDAASAPPSIRPLAASEAQPPGLKPRRADGPPPGVPSSSPSSSRIWLPPTFTPATTREEAGVRPGAASSAPLTAPAAPSTDLERSLQAFMQFDPDAPAAVAPAPRVMPSFTELDLDESDSLLHAVEAAATSVTGAAPAVEEAMEAPEDPRAEQGGLPKIPLFSDLPEDAFIALFEKCPLQRFEEGQLVFEQGDKADAFYVICGGQVRVFRTDGNERKELATLEEGSFFGEMALLSEAPRSASVEAAAEDTQVLVISAEILKELSSSYPVVSTALKKFCRQRMLSNLMNQAAIFAPFNRNDRRDLVQKFRARDVNRGDVLVKEGATSDGLYVVLSGEVAIEAKGNRIATLKEGQVFGEMSLLMRTPASATVRAIRHTSLLRLPKTDFDSLILSHPQVLEHVSVLIDERMKSDLKRQQNDAAEIL